VHGYQTGEGPFAPPGRAQRSVPSRWAFRMRNGPPHHLRPQVQRTIENKIRLAAAVALLLMAGYPAVLNWWGVISNIRNRLSGIDKNYSTGPLVSVLLSACAYLVYPFAPKGWIWILPAMDVGNWVALIGLPVAVIRGKFKHRPR